MSVTYDFDGGELRATADVSTVGAGTVIQTVLTIPLSTGPFAFTSGAQALRVDVSFLGTSDNDNTGPGNPVALTGNATFDVTGGSPPLRGDAFSGPGGSYWALSPAINGSGDLEIRYRNEQGAYTATHSIAFRARLRWVG